MKALHFLFEIIFLLSPVLIFFSFAMGITAFYQDWKANRETKNEKSAAGLQPNDAGKGGNL